MVAVSDIICLFQKQPKIDEIYEDFWELRLKIKITQLLIPTPTDLVDAFKKIAQQDKVIVDLKMDECDPITITSSDTPEIINARLADLADLFSVKDDDSNFFLSIKIAKALTDKNELNIYNFSVFIDYLNKIPLTGLLTGFKNVLRDDIPITFNLLDAEDCFYTDTFIFCHKNFNHNIANNRKVLLESADKVRYFLKTTEYPFIPEDFWLKRRSLDSRINNIMDKLALIYSVIFLTDFSNIEMNNLLKYRCCGYRTLEGCIDFKDLNSEKADLFFRIYHWTYTEGNLADKVCLARNVMTLHISDNDLLSMTEEVHKSIQSNYAIYLKQNLQQYIDIKNQVIQLMYEMSQKTNGLIDNFSEIFKKNMQWLLTFYISVLLFNTLATGKITNIFTREIAYISFGLLFISVIILIVSIVGLNMRKNRFIEQYEEVKQYYDDLLDPNDILRIFKEDEVKKTNISFIEKQQKVYVIAWIAVILTMALITYALMIK